MWCVCWRKKRTTWQELCEKMPEPPPRQHVGPLGGEEITASPASQPVHVHRLRLIARGLNELAGPWYTHERNRRSIYCERHRVGLKTKRLIRVGHSPDPDDAFMFYALAQDKIDTNGYRFEHELVDIETLNRRAQRAELELTAVSLHAYAYLADKYILCPCGASMGDNYGPMVVAARPLTRRAIAGLHDRRSRHADHRLPGVATVSG